MYHLHTPLFANLSSFCSSVLCVYPTKHTLKSRQQTAYSILSSISKVELKTTRNQTCILIYRFQINRLCLIMIYERQRFHIFITQNSTLFNKHTRKTQTKVNARERAVPGRQNELSIAKILVPKFTK